MSGTLSVADVGVGDELGELAIPITRTLIVAGAIASRDYQDVHHDHELAAERGSPDIFMNILTTNGLVGRYVTDWAGPGARLVDVDIRLGAPNYPGDTMVMRGRVTEVDRASGTVVVGLRGSNRIGDHVTGVVRLVLPATGAAVEAAPAAGEAAPAAVDAAAVDAAAADLAGSGRNGTDTDGHEERT